MTRSLLAVGLALCVGLMLVTGTPTAAQPAPAPPKGGQEAELVQKVKDSIDKGVRYLKKQQHKDGDWEGIVLGDIAGLKGGVTSLATLALLNAGLKPDDPAVARALEYLRKLGTPEKTYVVALQTMVLAEARDPKDLPQIQKNVEWIRSTAIYREGKLEGWSYPYKGAPGDNSNTQYALLGLYAAKTAGGMTSKDPKTQQEYDKLWADILEYYTRTQKADPLNNRAGFWTYHTLNDPKPSFTMSVGGTCGLLIASMGLDKSEQKLNDATGVAADCGLYSENTALAKGMFWVGANFNFMEGKSYFYNYYGIERLGRLSGQRFIGKIDWYREGCERLVRMQEPDGSFLTRPGQPGGSIDAGQPVITTSFAMLFLSKGRTPVLVSKFAWGRFKKGATKDQTIVLEEDLKGIPTNRPDWNRKHNDCRHMVEFAARELFDNAPLSWQVYDPRLQGLSEDNTKIDSEVALLLQSPVVYLNGHGAMPFVGRGGEQLSAEEQLLKRYVEEGGFLLAEACCGDTEFAASFETLVGRLFTGSTLKRMPPEHSIWTMFPGITPADFPDLMYLDRGCRTVAVFSASPLAGYWEEGRFMPSKEQARAPANRGQKAYCLSRNIIAYATGMELPKPKLTKAILVNGADGGIARSKFRALQLQYISDATVQPPPAAGALRNLMAFLGQNAKLDVALTSEVMSPGDRRILQYGFMYLHGRKPVTFDEDSSDNIKANLQKIGLLFADAACNDFKQWKAFDKSFRDAMEKMWGQPLVPIPETVGGKEERLYQIAREAGINLKAVKCRREKPDGSGPEQEMRTYPVLLEGIKVDGRWVVVYSKYDIGCAIEGHKSADCLGHDKESALRIAAAVVLYALKR
jgi:hypothetical protein